MSSMGEMISDEEINEMLDKWDLNKNGVIEYDEFVKAMLEE